MVICKNVGFFFLKVLHSDLLKKPHSNETKPEPCVCMGKNMQNTRPIILKIIHKLSEKASEENRNNLQLIQNYSGQAKLDGRGLLRKPTIAWAWHTRQQLKGAALIENEFLQEREAQPKIRIRCCLLGKGWRPTLWFQKASAQRQSKGREADTAASPVTTELHGPWRCAPTPTVCSFRDSKERG